MIRLLENSDDTTMLHKRARRSTLLYPKTLRLSSVIVVPAVFFYRVLGESISAHTRGKPRPWESNQWTSDIFNLVIYKSLIRMIAKPLRYPPPPPLGLFLLPPLHHEHCSKTPLGIHRLLVTHQAPVKPLEGPKAPPSGFDPARCAVEAGVEAATSKAPSASSQGEAAKPQRGTMQEPCLNLVFV